MNIDLELLKFFIDNFKYVLLIKCIDNTAYADHLTEGELYITDKLELRSDGLHCRITDDNGGTCFPFFDRFKISSIDK